MMIRRTACMVAILLGSFAGSVFAEFAKDEVENPAINMRGHLRVAARAARHRERRRLREDEFIRMSRAPGTIVLDTRSEEKYDEIHVRGAVHLNFSDITEESVREMIPDSKTRILIYCNNNFRNAPDRFPAKTAVGALNLSTYIALYSYGYRNIYELGPLIDINTTKLEFEGTDVGSYAMKRVKK